MLVVVQLFAIACHVPLIALAYADYFVIKATLQSLVYAIKLKLDFIVLSHLLEIVKHGIAPRGVLHDIGQHQSDAEARANTDATSNATKRQSSLAIATRRRPPTSSPPEPEKQPSTGLGEVRNTVLDDSPTPQQRCMYRDSVGRAHRAEELSISNSERKYLGQSAWQI